MSPQDQMLGFPFGWPVSTAKVCAKQGASENPDCLAARALTLPQLSSRGGGDEACATVWDFDPHAECPIPMTDGKGSPQNGLLIKVDWKQSYDSFQIHWEVWDNAPPHTPGERKRLSHGWCKS